MQKVLKDFSKGIITRVAHGKQPEGSFYDCKNLFNKKKGGLSLRNGVSNYTAVLSSTAGNTITQVDDFHIVSTENPSAQDIFLILGQTSGSAKKIIQSPWFDAGGDARTTGLEWGETFTTTISALDSTHITLTAGSTGTDYCNGWIVYNSTRDSSSLPYLITDYSNSTRICTILGWTGSAWQQGDTVVLCRHFHDNPTFSPTYVTPGTERSVALCKNDATIFSGGKSSAAGCVLLHANYISKTFFPSVSSGVAFALDYVSEAEVDTEGIDFASTSGAVVLDPSSTQGLDQRLLWFIAVIGETDDGQKSQVLDTFSVQPTTATRAIGVRTRCYIAQMNKRFKKLHFFMGSTAALNATTLDYSKYFFIKTIDLTGAFNTTVPPVAYSFTDYTLASTDTTLPKSYDYWVYFDNSHWLQSGESLMEFLGHTEATSTTVSCSLMTYAGGRLIVGRYHDYVSGLDYNDSIRYSIYDGQGVPNLDVLPNIIDFSESLIASGDPASLQSLGSYQGKLVLIKNRETYYVPISASPLDWELVSVAKEIGTDCPMTVVQTPYGVMFAKSGDDIYLWSGGYPTSMLESSWLDVFRAETTTNKVNWYSWYNPLDKTYNIYIKDDTFVWSYHFDTQSWDKHDYAVEPQVVRTRSDGRVYFKWSTSEVGVFRYFSTATTDATTSITPYFDSGEILLTEKDLAFVNSFWVNMEGTGTAAGTLEINVLVDNTSVKNFSSIDKTLTRFQSLLPDNNGNTVRIKINGKSSSPATWATSFELYEIGFEYDIRPRMGDKANNL